MSDADAAMNHSLNLDIECIVVLNDGGHGRGRRRVFANIQQTPQENTSRRQPGFLSQLKRK